MRYRFVTCDVFTATRFGGNQLAVLPDAEGLTPAQMQAVAAEFNYSETTFVLPPDDPRHLARVRIFTPKAEMPFAGHPTVGTALVLAWLGRVPADGAIVLEEAAGPVPVRVEEAGVDAAFAEFVAPVAPTHGPSLPSAAAGLAGAAVLSLDGLPCVASCGAPFVLAEVASLAALADARADVAADLPSSATGVLVFTRATADSNLDLRARMFAPRHGVPEDPATGSAAAALAGYLAGRPGLAEGWHAWRIGQGIEMGRPSLIQTRARRVDGRVVEVRVGGAAVRVAEGTIEVGM